MLDKLTEFLQVRRHHIFQLRAKAAPSWDDVIAAYDLYADAHYQHRAELIKLYGRDWEAAYFSKLVKGREGTYLRDLYAAREASRKHYMTLYKHFRSYDDAQHTSLP